MDIRPIRTEADYDAALKEIEQYFDREPEIGSPSADRFDILAALIGAYEQEHWPIEPPDAVSAIREIMTLRRYTQSDLATLLGSRSRASEILMAHTGRKPPRRLALTEGFVGSPC
jgi:HTH-type transcriptional regulator/antitoxin HigA